MYINDYNKWTLRHASFILNGATAYYSSGQAEIDALLGSDIPKQIKLNRSIDLCGYISPDGEYYPCEHCQHESLAQELMRNPKIFPQDEIIWYGDTARKPEGMSAEEYYLMRHLKFVKISSFKEYIDEMYLLHYEDLTPEQAEIVYPR